MASQLPAQTFNGDAQRELLLAPRLKKGDLIALTAPAGAIFNKESIGKARLALEGLGFRVRECESLGRQYGYLAGTDEQRAQELMELFTDDSVNGIVAMRGGWGCARLLPLLDFEKIRQHPKVLSGFSDITTLLLTLQAKTGLVTFHGPVGNSSWSPLTNRFFMSCVSENTQPEMIDSEADPICLGTAEGKLLGGNLAVLCSLLGTSYLPDFKDALLFLEETEEEPYSIDRMLTQLDLAGVLRQVRGVIFGKCTKCDAEEPEKSFTLREVLQQKLGALNIPAITNFSFGHTVDKYTFPVGVRARMDVGNRTVQLLENSVL